MVGNGKEDKKSGVEMTRGERCSVITDARVSCSVDRPSPSVWRVWFSIIVDGYRLHPLLDGPPDISRLNSALIRQNATSGLNAVEDDVDDDVSVDWCLRVVMTDVISLTDFDRLSRIFTDAYRSVDSGDCNVHVLYPTTFTLFTVTANTYHCLRHSANSLLHFHFHN